MKINDTRLLMDGVKSGMPVTRAMKKSCFCQWRASLEPPPDLSVSDGQKSRTIHKVSSIRCKDQSGTERWKQVAFQPWWPRHQHQQRHCGAARALKVMAKSARRGGLHAAKECSRVYLELLRSSENSKMARSRRSQKIS